VVDVNGNADITFGVTGQQLEFYVTNGVPVGASVKVFACDVDDTGTEEPAISGDVEVDETSTTVDATSGAGTADPRILRVTSTSNMAVGRTYLVSQNGLSELFEIRSIVSNDYVTTRNPLHNAWTSGASVKGLRLSANIDATWVADATNLRNSGDSRPWYRERPEGDDAGAVGASSPGYRVRWTYEIDMVNHVRDTYFDLVRYQGDHGVLPGDIDALMPGCLNALPTEDRSDQGRRIIAEAYRSVKLDLQQVGRADEEVANSEILDELVKHKTIQLSEWQRFVRSGGDERTFVIAKQLYDERLAALVRIVDRTPTRTQDGASVQRSAKQLTSR
jgi:hypothetical protein